MNFGGKNARKRKTPKTKSRRKLWFDRGKFSLIASNYDDVGEKTGKLRGDCIFCLTAQQTNKSIRNGWSEIVWDGLESKEKIIRKKSRKIEAKAWFQSLGTSMYQERCGKAWRNLMRWMTEYGNILKNKTNW